jgi:hypothetical protein
LGGAIYLLCAATALACSLLLLRGYARAGTRLLLWCGLFFLLLTLENIILFIDREILPEVKLLHVRRTIGVIGAIVLVYGLVWEGGLIVGRGGGAGWTK